MAQLKPIQIAIPTILVVFIALFAFAYVYDNDVDRVGLVGIILLMVGASIIIMGIFLDRYKQLKPLVNLGAIYFGSVFAIVSSVSLGWVSHEFPKWVCGVLVVIIILFTLVYTLALFNKGEYTEDDDIVEDD